MRSSSYGGRKELRHGSLCGVKPILSMRKKLMPSWQPQHASFPGHLEDRTPTPGRSVSSHWAQAPPHRPGLPVSELRSGNQ
jgi:hypothetical protein